MIMKNRGYLFKPEKLNDKHVPSLKKKDWSPFLLKSLFSSVQRGKRLTKANQIQGDYAYVSSTENNNGIDNFVGNDENVRMFKNCITIANSGSVGSSFYHPYKFVASDHVTHVKNEDFSSHIYLFLATQLKQLSEKYNFNREINDKRISKEKIMLPIDYNKNPDWEYMEQYMINLEIKKREKYSKREKIG
ncbi:MAG: type II restriction endonuclease subunit S [Gammaproteobacteria bacterium]|nr:type II restriction endonuclease subunit S [Gammaproteobacteria bacterium]